MSTPLYLYSESALNEAVRAYRELFPDNAKLFYSLKANPQPRVVQHLSSLELGAEITGQQELKLCVSMDILAGGVSKSEPFLTTLCHKNPAAIVIESETEWQKLWGTKHGGWHSIWAKPAAGTVNSSSRCKSRPCRFFGTTFLFWLTKTHSCPYHPSH
ncbi:MAG: hypothetical protein ABFS56_30485 [Pseudomonadota bacterium]